ncbi:MAG: hypothetical protein V7739_20175 [Motiliproteus sp.]
MQKIVFGMVLMMFFCASNYSYSANLEQTIKTSAAGGSMCKVFAEQVGGDEQAFIEMNIIVMQLAEKMGYTKDLPSFVSEVNYIRDVLKHELIKRHGSMLNVYNDWCIRFYKGVKNGIASGYN